MKTAEIKELTTAEIQERLASEKDIVASEFLGELRALRDDLFVRFPMLIGNDAAGLADRVERRVVLVVEGDHRRRNLPFAGRDALFGTFAGRGVFGLAVALVALEEWLQRKVDVRKAELLHFGRHRVHRQPVAPAANS